MFAQEAAVSFVLIPGADPRAGLDQYAVIVVRAVNSRNDAVPVAQSLGGF
jgi:hypothetical protein